MKRMPTMSKALKVDEKLSVPPPSFNKHRRSTLGSIFTEIKGMNANHDESYIKQKIYQSVRQIMMNK